MDGMMRMVGVRVGMGRVSGIGSLLHGLWEKAGRVLGSPTKRQLGEPGGKAGDDHEEHVGDGPQADDRAETDQVKPGNSQTVVAAASASVPTPTVVKEHLEIDVQARDEEGEQGNQHRQHHPAGQFERPVEVRLFHSQIEK